MLAALLTVVLAGALAPVGPAYADRAGPGSLFLVQGVTETSWTFTLDDEEVAAGAAAKEIVGPLKVQPGSHVLTAVTDDGTEVTATLDVEAGESLDAVLHRQVDPTQDPIITSFPNDLRAVNAGSGRLTVAHTAAVGPADIRVDKEVLFANVASGEELSVSVPGGTYSVDVVPASAKGPAVLGPVDLPVEADRLTRVFAIGVAEDQSMDAVVQVLKLPTRGSRQDAPTSVPGGDGGQAATSFVSSGSELPAWAPVLAAAGALVLLRLGLRRRPVRS